MQQRAERGSHAPEVVSAGTFSRSNALQPGAASWQLPYTASWLIFVNARLTIRVRQCRVDG